MLLVLSQLLAPVIMLVMVLIKGRDMAVRAASSSSAGRGPERGGGEGAIVEMSNLGRELTLGGAPVTRENRHLHMASSFRPTQKIGVGRGKREKDATEVPKASRGHRWEG